MGGRDAECCRLVIQDNEKRRVAGQMIWRYLRMEDEVEFVDGKMLMGLDIEVQARNQPAFWRGIEFARPRS